MCYTMGMSYSQVYQMDCRQRRRPLQRQHEEEEREKKKKKKNTAYVYACYTHLIFYIKIKQTKQVSLLSRHTSFRTDESNDSLRMFLECRHT